VRSTSRNDDSEALVTIAEAAAVLGIRSDTLESWRRLPARLAIRLRCVRLDQTILYRKSDVLALKKRLDRRARRW
jgi:hypothetical protein